MIFYRTMLRVIVVILLCACAAVAQQRRTSWKLKPVEPQMKPLKDAPLSESDRDEIYRAIEKTEQEERQAIMDFRVGARSRFRIMAARSWWRARRITAEPREIVHCGS